MQLVVSQDFGRMAKNLSMSERRIEPLMRKAGERTGERGIREYERTTATWTHRPPFEYQVTTQGYIMRLNLGTRDWIYRMLDVTGARAHTIRPRGPWPLRFQAQYTAKTTPGQLFSRAGGPSGPFVYAKEVRHPGIQPRRWSELVRDRLQPYIMDEMKKAITVLLTSGMGEV